MKGGAQKLTERELIKTIILKTIPNKWLQDLRRSNNHNLSMIEELKSVLKPIEEADENDQDSSRQKIKPRFDRPNNGPKPEEEVTTHVTRTVINTTGRTIPIINTGTSTMRVISKICNETPVKNEQYVLKTVMNQARWKKTRAGISKTKMNSKINTTKKALPKRIYSRFSLEDDKGNKSIYLGLLDTGSTASLMSEELVGKFELATKNGKNTWDTNNGEFKTGKTTVTNNLRFPQFTKKRKVTGAKFYMNKNVQQNTR